MRGAVVVPDCRSCPGPGLLGTCGWAGRAGEGSRESGDCVPAVVAGEGETSTACDCTAMGAAARPSVSTLQSIHWLLPDQHGIISVHCQGFAFLHLMRMLAQLHALTCTTVADQVSSE